MRMLIMLQIIHLRMEELGLGLVSLLRIAWIAATLPIIVAWLPLPGLGWFRRTLLGFARRGKILQSNTKLTVPQRFFSHFYVVAILWTTILLAAVWCYAIKMLPSFIEQDVFSTITSHLTGGSHAFSLNKSLSMREHVSNVWLSVFLLLLMEAQVLRRFYETIYVFDYSPSARMHIFGYLAGMFFYTAAPLSLCCTLAPEVFDFMKNLVAEFIVKGKDRMSMPEFNIWMFVTPFLRLRWYAWIGAAIFFWGWVHQNRCHEILGSHGFITTHKWHNTIGAFINLEVSGAGGLDYVCQSGPGSWPSQVYAESAVHPMGNSAAQLDDALQNGSIHPYEVYRGCLRMDGQTIANLEIFSSNADGGTSVNGLDVLS